MHDVASNPVVIYQNRAFLPYYTYVLTPML